VNLFDIPKLEKRDSEIESMMIESDFWDDNKKAQYLINELNLNKQHIETYKSLSKQIESILVEVSNLNSNYDIEIHQIIDEEFNDFQSKLKQFEIDCLLNEEYDNLNAIIEIHPGAGGTESQDWADMLYRMYKRYCEDNNFKLDTLDYETADDAGIKSVTFLVKGINAYGLLKGEKGVHRLVRISPFDSSSRRHTSFASVDVVPEFSGEIDIDILDSDLKIDTYRSSGAGGQHVNKTDSAVRITHIPTGIVVSCQNQRSQIQNKEQCLQTLKSKLYQRELEEQFKKVNSIRGEQKLIEWGSQIRSYVFCPYTLVKDHRTEFETSDVDSVMDGNLNDFIFAFLKYWKEK